ncbi:hypothetical protein HNY73_012209 [Argiope bruennichi]|uniref:Uncharacterized protein n=1 Tax=Argiope bruennichi TaxID=94029 RepID=A0A8T0EU86_ARGBR|nr:hypothetical protein HNY73_012209 [Argiope bruennichi]
MHYVATAPRRIIIRLKERPTFKFCERDELQSAKVKHGSRVQRLTRHIHDNLSFNPQMTSSKCGRLLTK